MRARNRFTIGTATAAVVLLSLAGCASGGGSGSGSGSLTTIKISTIGISTDAAISLGSDQGYFKKEGIKIETSVVANPPAGIAAVQGGQVQLAYSPSISVLTALSNGIKLDIVAAADGYPTNTMSLSDPGKMDDSAVYVTPGSGITHPKDLVGKTVAVPALKAQLQITMAEAIKKDGGDPSKVNWVVLDFPSAVAALKAGRVQAAGLVDPFPAQAKANGDKLLMNPGVSFFKTGAVGLWVTNAAEGKNTALMKKLQTAIYESNAYAESHIAAADARAAEITKVPVSTIKQEAPEYWPSTVLRADIERADTQLADLGYIPKPVDLDGVILSQPSK